VIAPQEALGAFIRRLRRHSSLSSSDEDAIFGLRAHVTQVGRNRTLVSPGTTVTHAILVADGLVARFDMMRNGLRQITALHLPGDMCDLHSVVIPRAGWGIASLIPSTVVHVPHGDLRSLANTHPRLSLAFWADVTLDASVLAKWLANLGRKEATSRLAHMLCEMGLRSETAGAGTRTAYRLNLTQEQIGEVVGLTGVHVNRTLRHLRELGLVVRTGPDISILDWNGLAATAEFSPDFLLQWPSGPGSELGQRQVVPA
jgi:CRP-like cAMP-binding protein